MRYGSTLWSAAGLKETDVERCILTVARTLDAEYEWHQHVAIARDLGVSETHIKDISAKEFDHFDDHRADLLRYVQAVAENEVDDEAHANLATHVEDSTVVGATLLATHYVATARFLDALYVPLGSRPSSGGSRQKLSSWVTEFGRHVGGCQRPQSQSRLRLRRRADRRLLAFPSRLHRPLRG